MKNLILLTGDLATGKSRFAEILAKRYGITALYKDKVKELLADNIGFANREENMSLSLAAVEIMIHCFSEMGESGQDLILEANFKEAELRKINDLATDLGYDTLTLVLRADMDIIYNRFVTRIEKENRHPAHISGFDGYESLKFYIDKGREQAAFGRVIEVSANDFSYQSDSKLLAKIDRFIGKK